MDDATLHLINRRINYSKPKQSFSKEYSQQILDLTKQLMEHKQSGDLQEAFDQYVSECIHYLKHLEQPTLPTLSVLECDKIMFPPKKINVFIKKK
jgi:hypothetical protein